VNTGFTLLQIVLRQRVSLPHPPWRLICSSDAERESAEMRLSANSKPHEEKMRNLMKVSIGIGIALLSLSPLSAQTPAQTQVQAQRGGDQPLYKITINVVERTAKAINYRHRGGATKIDFRGTALLPEAHGEAKVESKQGYIEIEVEFDELQSATRYGPEYLTYVMWAITPEGRAQNLGEVLLNGTESKLNVTTELQAFGLIVTAEPYSASHSRAMSL